MIRRKTCLVGRGIEHWLSYIVVVIHPRNRILGILEGGFQNSFHPSFGMTTTRGLEGPFHMTRPIDLSQVS